MNAPDAQAALEAVEGGDPEALAPLLWENPNLVHVTLEPDGRSTKPRPTLLHRANCGTFAVYKGPPFHHGHLQVAQLLIDLGADIDSTVDGSMPPLEMAVWSRNPEMVELLIANGADIERYTEAPPVEVAVLYQRRDIFKLLIAAGAKHDISHTLRLGMMPETRALLKADPSLANTETAHGLPLNLAVNKPGIFKLLLRHGADIHTQDSFGLTPLKAARIPESDKVVQTLLEMGVEDDIYGAMVACDEAKVAAILKADPMQAQPVASWPERGPLPPVIWAIWSGSTPILRHILQQEVPLDFVPNPLSIAILYQYDEMVRLLLDHGASPECEYPKAWPGAVPYPPYHPMVPNEIPRAHLPLYHALRQGTLPAAEMLLKAGADPNSTRSDWSGLQWPARAGNLRRAKFLLDRGVNPKCLCAERSLRLAARQCMPALIELLVSHGVDVQATDEEGQTALDLAGKTDGTPPPGARASTREILNELVEIGCRSKQPRARALGERARLIDAIVDGDAVALREARGRTPELLDRELVRGELLHFAALENLGEVVDILVESGAPMTIHAATALGRIDVVASMLDEDPSLLEGGRPPKIVDATKFLKRGDEPPLMIAAWTNRRDVAAMLLDRGAAINRQVGWYAVTALHQAVDSESVETVRLLLSRGADVTIRTRFHHLPTPLQGNWPPTISRDEIRKLLIAHGAKPEEQPPHSAEVH